VHTGTLITPPISGVAALSRAPDRGTPTVARAAHQRLLRALVGPDNIAPFGRPRHPRPRRSIDRRRVSG
jgi:hypothetical protein